MKTRAAISILILILIASSSEASFWSDKLWSGQFNFLAIDRWNEEYAELPVVKINTDITDRLSWNIGGAILEGWPKAWSPEISLCAGTRLRILGPVHIFHGLRAGFHNLGFETGVELNITLPSSTRKPGPMIVFGTGYAIFMENSRSTKVGYTNRIGFSIRL